MISKNLAQRLAVAAVAIPAILFLVFRGGPYFLWFVLLLAAVGIGEYLRGIKLPVLSPLFWLPFISVVSSVYLIASNQALMGGGILLTSVMLTGLLLATGREPVETLYYRLSYITWGTVYAGTLYAFVYIIRGEAGWLEPSPGRWWLFLLMGSMWLGDTAAMFFGKQFGKHQLAPAVSPNKTIEGFIGGFTGVFVVAVVFKLLWLQDVSLVHFAALSLIIGLFGQLGDLVESLWKRSIKIKDSSAIIPGHGGVLDRFDSLLYAAPPVFVYLKYVMHLPWL